MAHAPSPTQCGSFMHHSPCTLARGLCSDRSHAAPAPAPAVDAASGARQGAAFCGALTCRCRRLGSVFPARNEQVHAPAPAVDALLGAREGERVLSAARDGGHARPRQRRNARRRQPVLCIAQTCLQRPHVRAVSHRFPKTLYSLYSLSMEVGHSCVSAPQLRRRCQARRRQPFQRRVLPALSEKMYSSPLAVRS